MIIGLLSIFGIYGLAVALIHLGKLRLSRRRREPVYYLLVTRNNALHIEWYLRTLFFFSRLKARAVHVTVMDERSEDETLAIAERLAAAKPDCVEIAEWADESQLDSMIARYEHEKVVLVRLGNTKELQSIPLF